MELRRTPRWLLRTPWYACRGHLSQARRSRRRRSTPGVLELFAGQFERLHLFVPDPYDLALSKLTRNLEIDIEDMKHLAEACNLNIGVLSWSAMTPSFGQSSSGPSSVTTRRFSCGPKPSGNNGEAGADCDPNCDPTLPKYGVLLRFTDCYPDR
jgi:hypothetical protein